MTELCSCYYNDWSTYYLYFTDYPDVQALSEKLIPYSRIPESYRDLLLKITQSGIPGSFSRNTLKPAYFATFLQVPGRLVKNRLHLKKLALSTISIYSP